MLFLAGATLLLSHEQTRSTLENVVTELAPIAADHLFALLASTVALAIMSLLWARAVSGKADKAPVKQGAYGAVVTHKHSVWDQISRLDEVWAALKLVAEKKLAKPKAMPTRLPAELWDHLNKTSRSFAAVIRVLPAPDVADAVCVFYLVLRALDTIEDEMDLSKFDEFRKDGETALEAKVRLLIDFHTIFDDKQGCDYPLERILKSTIGAAAERALLGSVPMLIAAFREVKQNQVIKEITMLMGKGMAEYVVRDMKLGTHDEKDYDQYCHIVAGLVGKGLTDIFCNLGYEDAALTSDFESWNCMGLLLQKCNITRDVCEDAAEGRSWWPQSIWKSGENPPDQLRDLRDLSILNKMVANALQLVPQATKYLDKLKTPSVFGFCALPQIMALATLAACYSNPDVYTGVVKIRAGQAAYLVLALRQTTTSAQRKAYKKEAARLVNEIRHKAVAIGDVETIAGCDRALAALGGQVEKKLVTTSSGQIALSYTAFLALVYAAKAQPLTPAKLLKLVEFATGNDPGLTLAFVIALASSAGWCVIWAFKSLAAKRGGGEQ